MPTSDLVQPAADAAAPAPVEAAPGATPAPEAAAPAKGGEVSDAVLKIPAMQSILAGNPAPAFSVDFKSFEKTPEAKEIASNRDGLLKMGIFFYHARAGNMGVVGNSLKISPDSVKQADEAGTLSQIAPDFQTLNTAVASSGENNPVLSAQPPSGGAASPTMPVPPQTSSGAMPSPAPASVQTKLAGARSKNMQPGSPTSGPRPGGGRLLNAVLKRAQ